MNADDVVLFERLDAHTPLRRVVGVEIAGRAGDVDPRPAGQHGHAAHQVDGRDDGTFEVMNSEKFGTRVPFPVPKARSHWPASLPAATRARLTG